MTFSGDIDLEAGVVSLWLGGWVVESGEVCTGLVVDCRAKDSGR